MATPELAPRHALAGVVAVWVFALLVGVAIGIFVAPGSRAGWLLVGLGGCLVAGFVVQFWNGHAQGFTWRVAASVLGSLLVLGVISAGFGLAAVVPG